MIADDLVKLVDAAYNRASNKEKVFYLHLAKEEVGDIELGDSILERLLHDAFVLRKDSSDALAKLQRSMPVKDIHYSKNLIELVAAATIDFSAEEAHVEAYLSEHSLREAYLMNLFLGVEIPASVRVLSKLDILIQRLFIEKTFADVPRLFSEAILSSQHIFDAMILKELYTLYLTVHPDSKSVIEYEELKATSVKVSKTLNGIIIFVLSAFLSVGAVKYINWYFENQTLHDEVQKIVLQIFSALFIVAVFLGLNVPDKVMILTRMRRMVLSCIYFCLGLKYADVEKMLELSDKK